MAISITKPTVNGSNNTWGTTLNNALEAIESTLNGTGTGKVTIEPDLTQGSWSIDGNTVTATGPELNMLDGDTTATATTLEDGDRILVNDNGVMKQVAMSDFSTYVDGQDLHPDISAASSVNNSGSTFIQDITLDSNGHITGLTSAAVPAVSGTVSFGGLVNTKLGSISSSTKKRLFIGSMQYQYSRTGTWSGSGSSLYYAKSHDTSTVSVLTAQSSGGNFTMTSNYNDATYYDVFIFLDAGMTMSSTQGASNTPTLTGIYLNIED